MAGGLLVLFLGMYSWNQRTHTLDDIAANVGLEMSGTVLGTFDSVKGSVMDAWRRYVDLVGVREENERLRAQVAELQARIVSHGEDLAELARLRELVQWWMETTEIWMDAWSGEREFVVNEEDDGADADAPGEEDA